MTTDGHHDDDLRAALQKVLGHPMADALMSKFPPDGWGDVARSRDVVAINARIDQLDARMNSLETRMNSLDTHVGSLEFKVVDVDYKVVDIGRRMDSLERHFDIIDGRLKWMIATSIAGFFAVVAVQTQIALTLAGL